MLQWHWQYFRVPQVATRMVTCSAGMAVAVRVVGRSVRRVGEGVVRVLGRRRREEGGGDVEMSRLPTGSRKGRGRYRALGTAEGVRRRTSSATYARVAARGRRGEVEAVEAAKVQEGDQEEPEVAARRVRATVTRIRSPARERVAVEEAADASRLLVGERLRLSEEYILSLQRERLAAQARERRDRDQVTARVEEKKKEKNGVAETGGGGVEGTGGGLGPMPGRVGSRQRMGNFYFV